ncbi:hypothetical protein DFH28DRAFT_972033 [Melampsora americana]|nr:hypothetical protein DFH28DRAFT_972033 [Melampsora americana]
MRSPSNSKLKDIFLLWAITNVHFCVKGHPMVAVDDMVRGAGHVEGAGAATHVENGNNNFRVATSFAHETPNGRNLGTFAAASHPGTGSDDVKIAETMGKGHLNGIDALREQTKNLGLDGTSLAGKFDDSRSTSPVKDSLKASEQNPTPKELPVEDTPNKAPKVDTSAQNPNQAAGKGPEMPGQDIRESSPAQSISKSTKANLKETQPLNVKNTQENLLKSAPKTEKPNPLAVPKPIPDQVLTINDNTRFGTTMKYLKPAQVRELAPQDLIRYMSERDWYMNIQASNLDKLAQKYYKAEEATVSEARAINPGLFDQEMKTYVTNMMNQLGPKVKLSKEELKVYQQDLKVTFQREFLKSIEAHKANFPKFEVAFNNMQEARANWNEGFSKVLKAARQLVSVKSLSPEVLSKLSNERYVHRAAIFDENAGLHFNQWMRAEDKLSALVREWFPKVAYAVKKDGQDETINQKLAAITTRLQEQAAKKGEPIDPNAMDAVAKREFIKQEAAGLKDKEIQRAASAITKAGRSAAKAESTALGSANKVFKRNKLLESAALRYKHTGWSFTKFFKKIWAWIFRRGKKGQEKKSLTTTVKPSTGKGSSDKTASKAAPMQDMAKPVDQSEKNLVNMEKHTPEVEVMSDKSPDTLGNVNQPSSAENPNPSQGYWESWMPWAGKKVQPAENQAQALQNTPSSNGWFSWLKSYGAPSEKAPDSGYNYLSPFSSSTKEKGQPSQAENMKAPDSKGI